MTCRHCGKAITFEPETGGYWFHPATQSVYCWLSPSTPEERTMRAEP